MPTVERGDFEWDDQKAVENVRKHHVSFEEAETSFDDPAGYVTDDGAANLILIGFSIRARLLTVAHEDRPPRIRIISAWPSTAAERATYRGSP